MTRAVTRPIRLVEFPAPRPREDHDREYVLDVAAAGLLDSYELAGRRTDIEAVCELVEVQESEIKKLRAQNSELSRRLVDTSFRSAVHAARAAGLDLDDTIVCEVL